MGCLLRTPELLDLLPRVEVLIVAPGTLGGRSLDQVAVAPTWSRTAFDHRSGPGPCRKEAPPAAHSDENQHLSPYHAALQVRASTWG